MYMCHDACHARLKADICNRQELGTFMQAQGLLEEEEWEEVKGSSSRACAQHVDQAQLKQLEHQVHSVTQNLPHDTVFAALNRYH